MKTINTTPSLTEVVSMLNSFAKKETVERTYREKVAKDIIKEVNNLKPAENSDFSIKARLENTFSKDAICFYLCGKNGEEIKIAETCYIEDINGGKNDVSGSFCFDCSILEIAKKVLIGGKKALDSTDDAELIKDIIDFACSVKNIGLEDISADILKIVNAFGSKFKTSNSKSLDIETKIQNYVAEIKPVISADDEFYLAKSKAVYYRAPKLATRAKLIKDFKGGTELLTVKDIEEDKTVSKVDKDRILVELSGDFFDKDGRQIYNNYFFVVDNDLRRAFYAPFRK